MKVFSYFAVVFLLLQGVETAGASEDEKTGPSLDQSAAYTLGQIIRTESKIDAIGKRMAGWLRTFDIDGGGVSESDFVRAGQIKAAEARSRLLRQWTNKDLDVDGRVTRAELEAFHIRTARKPLKSGGIEVDPTPEQVRQLLDKLVSVDLIADSDGDGIVTFAEALAQAEKRRGRSNNSRRLNISMYDDDGDGTITEDEFTRLIGRFLIAFDGDGNGALSGDEKVALGERLNEIQRAANLAFRERQRREKDRKLAESCGYPIISKEARLILVSAYEGQALSPVALSGPDSVATVVDIRVESGEAPLYVVLASLTPVIWRFSGAVDRVSQVMASSKVRDAAGRAVAGIVGIPEGRVHFAVKSECAEPFYNTKQPERSPGVRGIVRKVGRKQDITVANYAIALVVIPSGQFSEKAEYPDAVEPPPAPGAVMWPEFLRFTPGGLVQIEAASVVSPGTAEPYEVLPQEAGIAQLLNEGALEVLESSRVITLDGGLRFVTGGGDDSVVLPKGAKAEVSEIPTKFLIVKKMRFPPGMGGAHSRDFVLAPGVPEPVGSPGHSRVERME